MTVPKPYVFVLMPFSKKFKDIYEVGIKAACKDAGTYCERIDEQIFQENILERIYNEIAKADYVIADMTGRNANVYYEVGYAHAMGKRVILLTHRAEDIPFDLKHYPHIIYDGVISYLKDELQKTLKAFIKQSKKIASQSMNQIKIWRNRDLVKPSFRERMQNATKSIFLNGFSFETLFKDNSQVLTDAIKRNVEVRILMLHPDSKHTDAHQEFSSRLVKVSINNTIENHMKFFYDEMMHSLEKDGILNPEFKVKLDIRVTYYLPRFAARICDDNMLINFYLYKSKAHENPTLEILRDHNKDIFDALLSSLNALFEYEGNRKGGHPNFRIVDKGEWKGLPNKI